MTSIELKIERELDEKELIQVQEILIALVYFYDVLYFLLKNKYSHQNKLNNLDNLDNLEYQQNAFYARNRLKSRQGRKLSFIEPHINFCFIPLFLTLFQ